MSQTYDPTKVMTIVDGFVLSGFVESEMITVSRMSDKRSTVVGAQGNVTVNKSADDRAEVTIKLKHTSPSNYKLDQLYNSDETFSFAALDMNFAGDVGGSGAEAVVTSRPDFKRGNEASDNEWTIVVFDYEEVFSEIL